MTRWQLGGDCASVDGNKIDWTAARAGGMEFAYLRGTYGDWPDPVGRAEYERARAAGLVVGRYMFWLPGPAHPPGKAQVRALYLATGPLHAETDLPPALDVEFSRGVAATGLSRHEILAGVVECVEELRRLYGVAPMIYTSRRVWDGEDADSLDADGNGPRSGGLAALGAVAAVELADCPLWLARYAVPSRRPARGPEALSWPPEPAAWGHGNSWVHQYQGDALGFPGFSRTVDLDRFHAMALGETGNRVRWAQRRLRMAEGQPGVFDSTMRDAVTAWQSARGLDADGIVGVRTFARLACDRA